MNMTTLTIFKMSLTAAALALAMAEPAAAAAAWDLPSTITSTNANANKNAWSDNAALTYDAWGMNGGWLSFNLTSTATTTISATSNGSLIAPAFTLYRTTDFFYTGSTVGPSGGANGTLMKFSGVAQVGQAGIGWATAPSSLSPGVVETLGYSNSGPAHTLNSFLQAVNTGANDVSTDNLYENGITGSIGSGFATLTLNQLVAGFYTIFVGGANSLLPGGPITVSVSTSIPALQTAAAVPLPGAVWLFGSALVGLISTRRRKTGKVSA